MRRAEQPDLELGKAELRAGKRIERRKPPEAELEQLVDITAASIDAAVGRLRAPS